MSDLASSPRESVNDFNSDEDLLNELVMDEITATRPTSGAPIPAAGNAQPRETEEGSWMLYEYDAQTTEAVTAYDEFRRLQVLRSYCALDIRDETIDRLTRTAALTFGVAGAWVCLVDFKRIVYFSTHGLDGLDVIPRLGRYGCAHAIQFRADRCYVVPDMSTNSLYEDMEFVNQAPFMKFYASAPLLSPEGFRIGTFGLIDPGARPGGLDDGEKEALVDYAAVAMKLLADHRFKIRTREKMARAIAVTSHHMVTPLCGLQLSLSLLKEDGQGEQSNFTAQQKDIIATAEHCSSVMSRICRRAFADVRTEMKFAALEGCDRPSSSSPSRPECSITSLIDQINQTVHSMQMTVPFVTRVDISIPPIIGCNDIKLFQLSITLLSMLTSRIDTGILVFRVRLDSSHLLLTISNPSELESPLSWESDNALIGLVTKLVTSMSGEFEQNKCDSDCPEGFLFRVRIPVEDHLSFGDRDISRDPELLHFGAIAEPMFDMDVAGSMSRAVEALQSQVKPSFQPPQDATLGGGVLDDPNIRLPRKKRSLIIDDSLVVRKSIGRALERLGYEVKLAVDGREGLDCLKEDVFDMTLCDFLMPNLDGFDCVQQYRAWETENRRWFRQRIIGISAHANENDVKRGLEVGMDDFHEKPITIEFLKNLHESAEMASISQQLDDILPLLPRLQNSREIGLWQMNGGLPIPPIPSATPRRNSEVLGKTTRWPGQMSNCLICLASEGEEWSSYPISSQSTETSGWDITITKGSDDAMRSLKAQNWGAVIMSCQLSPITACTSITTFRQWEAENRVNRQSNVFLLSSSYTAVSNRLPDTERLTMQPPSGFDSTITFDTSWGDFLDVLFETTARSETANVIVR